MGGPDDPHAFFVVYTSLALFRNLRSMEEESSGGAEHRK
jgi:hypothetical protein